MNLSAHKQKIKGFFNSIASKRDYWIKKNSYYYTNRENYFKFLISEGKSILQIGSGNGELLSNLNPSYGLGIDISEEMVNVSKDKYKNLNFMCLDGENISKSDFDKEFDYIIIADTIGYFEDIQTTLENLHQFSNENTRLIVSYYNSLWEPVFKLSEKLGLKMPSMLTNWLNQDDIENILMLSNYETVKKEKRLMFPKKIPLLNKVFEFIETLPIIKNLCVSNYIVARPIEKKVEQEMSVTVVIPCKNEKGNIEPAVQRLPKVGSHTEIIFIDGHSEDGTPEEIKRVIEAYPDLDIKFLVQDGKGKGDAVRKAFDAATQDILMILDADLTVPPEDIPKFYNAIVENKGEFINGTRLVYPMEDEAMRFLNMLGNHFFSLVFTFLLNQRLKDTLCGTKVLRKTHYDDIVANREYFGDFDPFGDFDLLFGASKLNLKITEVPIRYKARTYGETQISRFTHGWLLIKMSFFAIGKLKLI